MTERHDSAPTPPPRVGSGAVVHSLRLKKIPYAILAMLGLACASWIGYWGIGVATSWLHQQPDYLLSFDRIELVPDPPSAIRDGREGILRTVRDRAKIDADIPLLDADLDDLRRAFVLNSPWITRVVRVDRSRPRRLIVEVEYREPLARVEIGKQLRQVLGSDGAVVPSDEVVAKSRALLPTIVGLDAIPETSPGLFLGDDGQGKIDPKVASAVAVADFFRRLAPESLALRAVNVVEAPAHVRVTTRDGLVVHWRNPPGQEAKEEPSASEKLDILRRWVDATSKVRLDAQEEFPRFLQIDVSNGPDRLMVETPRGLWVHWRHVPGEEVDGELTVAEKLDCLRRWESANAATIDRLRASNTPGYLELTRAGGRLITSQPSR